jgi:hypothetical protein
VSQKSPLAYTTRLERPIIERARVLSGIQPSGELHIGNYLGAVRTWRKQIEDNTEETMFCIVDAHAITVPYEAKDLRARIDGFAIDLVACGLDPEKTTLFVQSDVREHTELAWYLASVTPMGDLGRMTQFKEKGEGKDFVSTALFTYPVLMSADILLYKATIVPVGGGLSGVTPLIEAIDRTVRTRTLRKFDRPLVVPGECRIEPGLIGAALLALAGEA